MRDLSLVRRARVAAIVGALGAIAASAGPAVAVDRSAGADVPKPVLTGTPWTDAEIAGLDASVELALGGAKTLRGAHVGLYAIDARDGRVLYAHNSDDAFQPASTLKLVVGSAALDKLGPAFTFRTDAYVVDRLVGRELMGPLRLRGGGDVLLDDGALRSLRPALEAAGIAAVHGVVADEPEGVPPYLPGWSWDDLPWYYAAPVTQLGLNDNAVTLRVTPGATPGAPVRVAVEPWGSVCYGGSQPCPDDLGFTIWIRATTGTAGSESTLDVSGGAAGGVTLTGTLAAGAPAETLSIAVPNPPRYAAFGAGRALAQSGFSVLPPLIVRPSDGAPVAGPTTVWTHRSEPLPQLLAALWLPSDNILAEELLRALGATPPALQGSSADGVAYEKTWLARLGIGADAFALADGSGLSVYDRITPRALVTVLKHDWDGPYRNVVLDALPIAGVRGTLAGAYAGTPAEKRVFAKTGSLSYVSTLAGFAANARHGAVIFAFVVDDWIGASADLRELRGRVLAQFVER